MATIALVPVGRAFAYDSTCDVEDNIFFKSLTSWGADFDYVDGADSLIRMTNRTTNTNCGGAPNPHLAGSTTHMVLSDDFHYVEVGFQKNTDGITYAFWEWVDGFGTGLNLQYTFGYWSCTYNWGDFLEYKIDNNTAGLWIGRFECPIWNELGRHDFGNYAAVWDGLPEVEVFRRGGTATGMSDHHHVLQYKIGNGGTGTWYPWIDMQKDVVSHDPSDWDGCKVAADHFETRKVGTSCP